MRDFKKLLIWKKGMIIVNEVYKAANSLPVTEQYGLRSQVTRCAVSIPTNIAEGSAKRSERDYKRFVEIALGSAFELETHLIIIQQQNFLCCGDGEKAIGLDDRRAKKAFRFHE